MIGLFAMLFIGLACLGLATAQEPGVDEPPSDPIAKASEIKPDAPFRPEIVIVLQVNQGNFATKLTKLQQSVREVVGEDVTVAFNVGPNGAARHNLVMASAGLNEETIQQVISRVEEYAANGNVLVEVLTNELVTQMYPTHFGESEKITKRYAITALPAPYVAGYFGINPWPKSLKSISFSFDTNDYIIIVAHREIQWKFRSLVRGFNSGEIDPIPAIASMAGVTTDELRDGVKLNVATPVGKRRLGAADRAIQKEARRLIATADGQPIQTESTKKLRNLVAKAFKVKQTDHRSELESLRTRMLAMESAIQQRDEIADQIIDRRVNELLDLDTEWNPGLASPDYQPAISPSDSTSPSEQRSEYYSVANTDINVAVGILQSTLRQSSGSKPKVVSTRVETYSERSPTTDGAIKVLGSSADHILAQGVIELLDNTKDDGIKIPVKGDGDQFLFLITKHFDDVDSAYQICSKILEGTADTRMDKDHVSGKVIIMTSRNNWDLLNRELAARESSKQSD